MRRIFALATLLAAAAQVSLVKATPAGAEGDMEISRDADRPVASGPSETFTGAVQVKPLFNPNEHRSAAAQVSFSPCARTAWHTHPAGQTLVVTSGTGFVQQWGGVKQQINPGDVIWTARVKHWHGATAGDAVSHIAIQGSVDGRAVDWLEHVSDEQYLG